MNYRCEYIAWPAMPAGSAASVLVERLDQVWDGFWVDDNFQFSNSLDCRFWIPPHQILYVEKVKE